MPLLRRRPVGYGGEYGSCILVLASMLVSGKKGRNVPTDDSVVSREHARRLVERKRRQTALVTSDLRRDLRKGIWLIGSLPIKSLFLKGVCKRRLVWDLQNAFRFVTDINVVGSVSNGNDELIMSRDLNRYALRARQVKFFLTTSIPNSDLRLLRETFSLGKQQGTWSSGYVTLSYPERLSIHSRVRTNADQTCSLADHDFPLPTKSMIPALGAGGHGFDSRSPPLSFCHGCVEGDVLYLVRLFSGQSVIRRLHGDAQGEHG